MSAKTIAHWSLGIGAVLLGGIGVPMAMEAGDARRYRQAQAQAVVFAARMGVVHGGCSNEACSGLRDGKPISYFCTPSGCVFETAGQP